MTEVIFVPQGQHISFRASAPIAAALVSRVGRAGCSVSEYLRSMVRKKVGLQWAPTPPEPLQVAHVASALHCGELERIARDRMAEAAQIVSVWVLAGDVAPRLSLGPDKVYAALCTVPAKVLVLLESPEGGSTLSGMVAFMRTLTPVPYSPTVH